MDHKLNRQALKYASMAVAGARQRHVVNTSCPVGYTWAEINSQNSWFQVELK